MQSAAQFIIREITTLMYLDDLHLITRRADAESHFTTAQHLLASLGLEVAVHTLQSPARTVTWLGINIDLDGNTISMPPAKLAEIQLGLAQASQQRSLTKKALQRTIGQINHLSKTVPPPRLFMGRLLAALRGNTADRFRVDRSMKADFSWFRQFLKDYNGRAIIPKLQTKREIWADACLLGGGATDGVACYSYTFPQATQEAHHITQLEAINCLTAARVLTTQEDVGNKVVINCDNKPAVDGGRAEDPVLNACARAIWFLSAQNEVEYEFNTFPGNL